MDLSEPKLMTEVLFRERCHEKNSNFMEKEKVYILNVFIIKQIFHSYYSKLFSHSLEEL